MGGVFVTRREMAWQECEGLWLPWGTQSQTQAGPCPFLCVQGTQGSTGQTVSAPEGGVQVPARSQAACSRRGSPTPWSRLSRVRYVHQ